jgi:cytochrome c-type biogenesis protein CcsB
MTFKTYSLLIAVLACAALSAGPLRAAAADNDADTAAAPNDAAAPQSGGSGDELPKPKLIGDLDFSKVEMLAIQEGGRKKPLQTYAMEHIQQIVGKPLFPFGGVTPYLKDKETGSKLFAMDMFCSLLFGTREWGEIPCILVSYGPLLDEMKLPRTEKYVSVKQLRECAAFQALFDSALDKRHKNKEKEVTPLEQEVELVMKRVEAMHEISDGFSKITIVPHPSDPQGTWLSLGTLRESFDAASTRQFYTEAQARKVMQDFRALDVAYRNRDDAAFTAASAEFRATLVKLSPVIYPSFDALEREVSYNKLHPFGFAWLCYLGALALGLAFFKFKSKAAYATVFAVFFAGLTFHVYGFALRCMIAGRPPVSNMYESVVWVGFGAVFFSMVFELIYRKRYFMICGATAGFLCLVLMDMLPVFTGNPGEPGFAADIKPLVPVLRNNFWLTVHVLTITLSYAAFMLTCVLGHVTLYRHLVEPGAKDIHRELHQYVYRAMQVGVLLIACGTILGGVWAYYSWGRFWGWDPKETWAFITLMCYLVVLHGRFSGLWGNFGMSMGAVVCFNSVVMAWYGVNFVLGSGLHAYGAGAGGQEYVLTAVALDMIFAVVTWIRYTSYHTAIKRGEEIRLTDTDPVDEVRSIGADDSVAAK